MTNQIQQNVSRSSFFFLSKKEIMKGNQSSFKAVSFFPWHKYCDDFVKVTCFFSLFSYHIIFLS